MSSAVATPRSGMTAFTLTVVLLCGGVLFLDGFDTQAISYIAPVIAKQWHLSHAVLGPIFSSALVGLMVGYLAVAPLSDRFGHRRLIVVSTAFFGLFTLATVFAQDLNQLIGLRFLTGIGLGAAAPSAIALTSEYSPRRLRATLVLAIYCGFSLGFVAAGILAGTLLPHYGWRSLLWVGAIAPLVIAPLSFFALPESLAFLRTHGASSEQIAALARRSGASIDTDDAAAPTKRASITALFTGQRALGTMLLWFAFLVNLGEFYFIQSWLPTILTGLDQPAGVVVTATTLSTVGGIVAAFAMGPSMDRLGAYRSVAVIFVFGFLSLLLTGATLHSGLTALLIATFALGFFVSGGQKSVIALSAIYYPIEIRSSGVGWALGIGRIGGIGGPLIAGWLFAKSWSGPSVFYVASIPLLLAAFALFALERRYAATASSPTVGAARLADL